ncbi:MAG: hypothetical protein GY849_01640 [Deltaproteobacteria bacterium]|nr:hypothetical protein [Deltaproteobacteria bacterium]
MGAKEKKEYRGFVKGAAGLFFCLAILLLAAGPATAHRVVVFAWVEGDIVHVEGKFAGGKRVKAGKVTVLDLQGNRLSEGRIDGQGRFSFKAPQKRALKIVLEAGMGHRGEWILSSEDIQGARPEKEGTAPVANSGRTGPKMGGPGLVSAGRARPDEMELAVERALDKKLGPIMKMLSETKEEEASLKDILGGIGYILGLMGVAAYFHYRRRSADGKKGK